MRIVALVNACADADELGPCHYYTTHCFLSDPLKIDRRHPHHPPGMSASFFPPLQLWMGPDFQLFANAIIDPPWMVVSVSSPT